MLWEELTADEFEKAVADTKGLCIIPFGVIEKHGSHLPLCTDVETARKVAIEAAKIEPAVVFPYYYFGQIACGRHCPGTISIPNDLMFALLDEVCREISRNGFKKIIILNSHGGNINFVRFFIQCCLRDKKDYVVYGYDFTGWLGNKETKDIEEMLGTDDLGDHAGNFETSVMLAIRPDLVKMGNVDPEKGTALKRLRHLHESNIFTGIWWYADYPHHFAGDTSHSSKAAGERILEYSIKSVARAIRLVKEDKAAPFLQSEFFERCSF